MPALNPTAQRLLDAHVAFEVARYDDDRLGATVAELAGRLLEAVGGQQIADVVDARAVKDVVRRALTTVPASAAVSGFVELGRELLREGPAETFTLAEVVDREQVEAVLDEALALTPVVERALGRLSASPLVGAMATQFMTRIVGEVLQANKAMADKVIPGLGSLMSFGTSAASKVVGAADSQLQGLLGDTVGKGGAYAVGRMNKIVVETLQDPTTREAVLQVWDLVSQEQVRGLGEHVDAGEVAGLVDAVHELVITTLADERVVQLGEAVVDGFLERFGGYTTSELLVELDLDSNDLVADLARLAPGAIGPLRESGELERLVRARLEPFYASDQVAAILT